MFTLTTKNKAARQGKVATREEGKDAAGHIQNAAGQGKYFEGQGKQAAGPRKDAV